MLLTGIAWQQSRSTTKVQTLSRFIIVPNINKLYIPKIFKGNFLWWGETSVIGYHSKRICQHCYIGQTKKNIAKNNKALTFLSGLPNTYLGIKGFSYISMKGWADESVGIFFVSSPSSIWSLDAEAVKGPQNISTFTWKTWLANKPNLTSIQPKHGFRFDRSGKTYLTYLPGKYQTLLISGLGSQNYCGPGNSKCQAHSQKKLPQKLLVTKKC